MTTYWVRHPSLSGFVGPLTAKDLRAAILALSLPGGARVHAAVSGAAPETFPDAEWVLATELLGLPRAPAEATSSAATTRSVRAGPVDVRAEIREQSRYAGVRRLAAVLCGVAILTVVVGSVSGLDRVPRASLGVAAVLAAALQVAIVLVGYSAFTMLADIADCQLRQHERQRDSSLRETGARG